jgi:hypothetical protein
MARQAFSAERNALPKNTRGEPHTLFFGKADGFECSAVNLKPSGMEISQL